MGQNNIKDLPVITWVLIIANAVAYLYFELAAPPGLFDSLALSGSSLEHGEWWTLFSSMFMHGGLVHIGCNLLSLYYLGIACEKIYGHMAFVIIYFISGVAGGLVFVGWNMFVAGDPYASCVGASGAIFGLFGGYAVIILAEYKNQTILASPINKNDLLSLAAILAVNIVIGFSPGSNIANEAHIGGAIAGFFVGLVAYFLIARKYRKRRKSPYSHYAQQ